jgi:hypothetical protein
MFNGQRGDAISNLAYAFLGDDVLSQCESFSPIVIGDDVVVTMRLRRPDGSEYEIEVPRW